MMVSLNAFLSLQVFSFSYIFLDSGGKGCHIYPGSAFYIGKTGFLRRGTSSHYSRIGRLAIFIGYYRCKKER